MLSVCTLRRLRDEADLRRRADREDGAARVLARAGGHAVLEADEGRCAMPDAIRPSSRKSVIRRRSSHRACRAPEARTCRSSVRSTEPEVCTDRACIRAPEHRGRSSLDSWFRSGRCRRPSKASTREARHRSTDGRNSPSPGRRPFRRRTRRHREWHCRRCSPRGGLNPLRTSPPLCRRCLRRLRFRSPRRSRFQRPTPRIRWQVRRARKTES